MEQQLIPNNEEPEQQQQQQQQQQTAPPTYAPDQQGPPMVAYPQVVYGNPHQGYVIQNAPVAPQESCCSGQAERFRHKVGKGLGVTQIVLAVVVVIASGVGIGLGARSRHDGGDYGEYRYYSYMHDDTCPATPYIAGIALSILFFVPTGILGACSQKKNSCVVVGYMVMCILTALAVAIGVKMVVAFGLLGNWYWIIDCSTPDTDYSFNYFPACEEHLRVSAIVLHSMIGLIMVVQFIIAIVGAAYCCGGLRCCCAGGCSQTTTNNNNMMPYAPMGGLPPVQPAREADAGPLPTKA